MTDAERHAAFRARVRGTEPPSHGSTYAYNAYGCRCLVCREAMRAKNAGRVYAPKLRLPRVVIAEPRTAPVAAPTSSWWLCADDQLGQRIKERFA